MGTAHKKIGFDDIRRGDTIRVVDVRDVKVGEVYEGEVRTESGASVVRDGIHFGVKRTFQLLDREYEGIPTKLGSVIEVDGERYMLVNEMYAATHLWLSVSRATRSNPEYMQRVANDADGFEVIA